MRLGLPFTIAACLMMTAAKSQVVVTWDASRGGISSLGSAAGFSALRNALTSQLPSYVIRETSTLTASSLSGASFVWLGVASGQTTAVTPLSTLEQQALTDFLFSGGSIVLFGDNSTFSPSSPATQATFFSPFGISITGTLNGTQTHQIVDSSNYVANGTFGVVGNYNTGFPGWFTTLPTGTIIFARFVSNNQPSAVIIPAGTLGAGTGNVVAFSDSGAYSTGGANSGDFERMYLNILSRVGRLQGDIELQDYVGSSAGKVVTLELLNGSTVVHSTTVTLDASGNYAVGIPPSIPNGSYDLRFKGSHWLAQQISSVSVTLGALSTVNASLINGDVDGDNEVGPGDFARLATAFLAVPGDSNWDAEADLDGDEEVGPGDFAILSNNFLLSGD